MNESRSNFVKMLYLSIHNSIDPVDVCTVYKTDLSIAAYV